MDHLDRRQRILFRAAVCVVAGVLAAIPQPGVVVAAALAVGAIVIGRWFPSWPWIVVTSSVMGVLAVAFGMFEPSLTSTLLAELPFAILRLGAPWLIGLAWRFRVQLRDHAVARLEDRTQRLVDAEQQKLAQLRLRLADELHDDLGHALSLLALRVGRLELDGELPEHARADLAETRRDLAEAVDRLGESVRAVRSGEEEGLRPVDDLRAVLDRASAAGVDLVVHRLADFQSTDGQHHGDVVRVLRELITNAVKHAPGSPVHLEVRRDEGTTVVQVWNTAAGSGGRRPRGERAGTQQRWGGLDSLRRDVEAKGGAVTITADRAFRVVACVADRPDAPLEPAEYPCPDESARALLETADRRARRVLLAAAIVVLAALAGVELLRVSL